MLDERDLGLGHGGERDGLCDDRLLNDRRRGHRGNDRLRELGRRDDRRNLDGRNGLHGLVREPLDLAVLLALAERDLLLEERLALDLRLLVLLLAADLLLPERDLLLG